jgi:hypothetical protein
MQNRAWVWLFGLSCVVASCGGRASENKGLGAAAGSPAAAGRGDDPPFSAPSGTAGAPSGTGGAPSAADDAGSAGIAAGASSESPCAGTFEDVAKFGGGPCPKALCDGMALATDCSALPGSVQRSCTDHNALIFELSATRRMVCYYDYDIAFEQPPNLVGASVFDDEASFCDGTATELRAGSPTPNVARDCDGVPLFGAMPQNGGDAFTLCDVAHPELTPANGGNPPRACLDQFSMSCQVCCPNPTPDCSGKPNGYPGYDCSPSTPDNPSYCSCSCLNGRWDCAC